jgi:DSBA-like thioredoxin domain
MAENSFAVTWDYLCPFARNAHEHLLDALEGGAPWEVTFTPFSLLQTHVAEGAQAVWEQDEYAKGVLALLAGIVVRDRFPERFLATHRALFAARHDEGRNLSHEAVVRDVLEEAGVPADEVFAQIADGWPMKELRSAHEAAVSEHEIFGVPTFVRGGAAVFVRFMTRPKGDAALARRTIDHVLSLIDDHPELNEFKYTKIPR